MSSVGMVNRRRVRCEYFSYIPRFFFWMEMRRDAPNHVRVGSELDGVLSNCNPIVRRKLE